MAIKLFSAICFVALLFNSVETIRWLSLQRSHLHWNLTSINNAPGRGIRSGIRSPCAIARRRYGLDKLQAKLCRNAMETMPHVEAAATLASETCRAVFKHRRWNCSSITLAPYLTPDLTRATREQAYVYALSSAALTYTMARACASGALYHCTCADNPKDRHPLAEGFQWGGCGDNLKWGARFAKRFIDNVEKSNVQRPAKRAADELEGTLLRNQLAVLNLHNNKVIGESLRMQCKCHGVSGSCNIRTCWRALPSLVDVGQRLLKRYTTAREVAMSAIDTKRIPASDQLIYYAKSPDYCTKDVSLGSFGTVGRQCNVSSIGPDSCRQLCCGRGYRTVVEEKIERCQCKFYNCCYVKCKICRSMTQTHECS